MPYPAELALKERYVRTLLLDQVSPTLAAVFDPIVASPKQYQYRCVLDVKLLQTRDKQVFIGFSPQGINRVVAADHCPISMAAISDFFPELKRQALAKISPKYRNANLVVKTGDDGRVFWGGMGRRSLCLPESDYLWTQIHGKRIFYSMATFFQANLSILPELIERIKKLGVLNSNTVFYDLYGGVGLFGVALKDAVAKVILIEENIHAIKVAEYNRQFNQLQDFEIVPGRVEDHLKAFPFFGSSVAMIDPPRAGLASTVIDTLCADPCPRAVIYLSCNPESLARDLAALVSRGWRIAKIVPFDFFPRTRHLETLVLLTR